MKVIVELTYVPNFRVDRMIDLKPTASLEYKDPDGRKYNIPVKDIIAAGHTYLRPDSLTVEIETSVRVLPKLP